MNDPRVLQVMAGAAHGGAEGFFMRLVPALARSGMTQRAIIRTNAERAAVLRDAGLSVTQARFGGRLDFFTGGMVSAVVRDFRPDVVLAWMSRAARFCAASDDHVVAGRLGGYYDLRYYRRCTHLIGNTPDLCDYIVAQGWPSERTWYIPNFVDPPASLEDAGVDRAVLDTPAEAPLLLGLGRLHENKAFDVLIASLADLPGVHLWLAGEGPLEAALREQAAHLGVAERVRFLGWRGDVPALLAAADILVCPSRHEPLGNVVIEAWAHRTPVVAARSQGPGALIEDGRTGLLAPIDDAAALASAIRRILDSPALAADLASAGAAAYEADYTEAIVVERYRAFFEKVTA